MSKDLYLSASRIKTLESCSWIYFCKYHLKLPDKSNSGASRGTICHLIFELLFNKRHKKYVQKILDEGNSYSIKSIERLVKKHARKLGVDDAENLEMINEMILVGLKTDFFAENGKPLDPEFEFNIEEKGYKIKGFIDLPIIYKKRKEIIIRDYKSSKKKFVGEELTANIQAMMYSLVARKFWPKLKSKVQFIFLRFPKSPEQEASFSSEELDGFEVYLEEMYRQITDFDENTATSNFASDGCNRWMCGKDEPNKWICPFRKELIYFAVFDDAENLVKTSFTLEEIDQKYKENPLFKIKRLRYKGCPKFNKY